jgi:alkanesulfonate monooxygenase SsuD/methylene tetrahydromethanopterin reductase-like flavin-dependent oxidoreductase (luciferase family)
MKVWLFDIQFWPKRGERKLIPYPGTLWDDAAGIEQYQGHLKYLERADALGYDGVCLTEHHYQVHGSPSPNVMAAAVAARTSQAKLVLMGNCLPLHANPVRLAEELAMLDVLSNGRLVSGFLRGGFTEWYTYAIDGSEARGRFEEAWDLIVKCWTDPEPFDWEGTYYKYPHVSIMPRPLQKPHPPIVMPANTAESIEWAARKRVPLASSFSPTYSMKDTFNYYRKFAQEECGWTPGPEHCMVSRQVYVAPTNQQARDEAEQYIMEFFAEIPTAHKYGPEIEAYREATRTARSYAYKSQGAVHTPEAREGTFTFEGLQEDGFCIIGDPDYVTKEIKYQEKELGVGTLMTYVPFSVLPLTLATKSMELFAKEVLPNLR